MTSDADAAPDAEIECDEVEITEDDFDRLKWIGGQVCMTINMQAGNDQITAAAVALQAAFDALGQLVGTEGALSIVRDITGIDEETLH